MNCKEIIEKYLKDNGYDGLHDDCECGCLLDDFMPCDAYFGRCEPGYKSKPDLTDPEWAGCDWVVGPEKPQAAKEAGNDNI